MKKKFHSTKQSTHGNINVQPTQQSSITQQFKNILSKQHTKNYHIIDNPNLIFQLAQHHYTFNNQKDFKQNFQEDKGNIFNRNSNLSSLNNNRNKNINSRNKIYRHKSQDQGILCSSLNNGSFVDRKDDQKEPIKDKNYNNSTMQNNFVINMPFKKIRVSNNENNSQQRTINPTSLNNNKNSPNSSSPCQKSNLKINIKNIKQKSENKKDKYKSGDKVIQINTGDEIKFYTDGVCEEKQNYGNGINNIIQERKQIRCGNGARPFTSNLFSTGNNRLLNGEQLFKSLQQPKSLTTKPSSSFQRTHYSHLKQSLTALIQNLQKSSKPSVSQNKNKSNNSKNLSTSVNNQSFTSPPQVLHFSQIFQYEQIILKDYLSNIITDLKKQCVQKGELVQMIFNKFFRLIQKTLKHLTQTNTSTQKTSLTNQLQLHLSYQQIYKTNQKKVKQLGKKYNESHNVIDKLIYQLRYKRKQVKRLYKNLAICNDRLNQYKEFNVDLQSDHIDLLIETNQITEKEALDMLRKKIQINKEKYYKIKVGMNKGKLKETIQKELEQEKLSPQQEEKLRKDLFHKMNSITSTSETPRGNKSMKKLKNKNLQIQSYIQKQQSLAIQQLIEKFSTKNIQIMQQPQIQVSKTFRRQAKASTGINTDTQYRTRPQTTVAVTQTTFSDKIEFNLISTRPTQTPGIQKIKKTQNIQIQVDGDNLRLLLLKSKMYINSQVMDLSFYFDVKNRDSYKLSLNGNRKSFLKRDSAMSGNKKFNGGENNSISEITSDEETEDFNDKDSQFKKQRRQSKGKNVVYSKKGQKKISQFGTLNYSRSIDRNLTSKPINNRNSMVSYNHKKRTSQISEFSQTFNLQNFNKKNPQSKPKTPHNKSTLMTKDNNFLNISSNPRDRPSICLSINTNLQSLADNISMNQQKQKYIENYIMNKQQQYDIIEQNQIFDTFKNIVLNVNNEHNKIDDMSGFYKQQQEKRLKTHITEKQNDYEDDDGDAPSQEYSFLDPKHKSVQSSDPKLSQVNQPNIYINHRKQKKTKTYKPPSTFTSPIPKPIIPPDNSHYRKQKQSLKQSHFLQTIIQFTVKKSLIKKKLDSSNYNTCKQKSQFYSITQKIDPFMLDVECLLNNNMIKKKFANGGNSRSQVNLKSANRFLMMTYARSIDKIYRGSNGNSSLVNNSSSLAPTNNSSTLNPILSNNNTPTALLQNLIRPLFQSFQIIYGALKPQDIYKKMVSFISDIISTKQNDNFKQFIFFLGLDKSNINSVYLTTFDVILYLKLLQRLNLGNKINGYEIDAVWTSKNKVNMELVNVLEGENLSHEVVRIVGGKIEDLLEKLEEFVRDREKNSMTGSSLGGNNNEEVSNKINLFKVSRMIVQQIIKIRVKSLTKIQSLLVTLSPTFSQYQHINPKNQLSQQSPLKPINKTSSKSPSNNINNNNTSPTNSIPPQKLLKNQFIYIEPLIRLVQCCRISTSKKLYFMKYVEELGLSEKREDGEQENNLRQQWRKRIKKSELGMLLIRVGLVNFEELEERLVQIKAMVNMGSNCGLTISKTHPQILQIQPQHIMYLHNIELQSCSLLNQLIGPQLQTLYQISLIKNLFLSTSNPLPTKQTTK